MLAKPSAGKVCIVMWLSTNSTKPDRPPWSKEFDRGGTLEIWGFENLFMPINSGSSSNNFKIKSKSESFFPLHWYKSRVRCGPNIFFFATPSN